MAYSSDIARALTVQITKFASLNRHQLVGQLANLDFWTAEVRHCLDVIDGYGRRFEQMKAAQMEFVADRGTVKFHLGDPCLAHATSIEPPRRVPSQELKEAKHQLREAFYRFLIRCFNESLLDEHTFRRICQTLDIGVESGDLRQRS